MAHKPVKAGEMTTKVEFQKNVASGRAASGQLVPVWQTQFTRKARVIQGSPGREIFRDHQNQQVSAKEITVWYDKITKLVNETWRLVIVKSGQIFNVVDVDDFEQKGQELVVTAIRGQGGWINLAGDATCSATFSGEAA